MGHRPAGCGDRGRGVGRGMLRGGSCQRPSPDSTGWGVPWAWGSPAGRENGVDQRPALRHFGQRRSDLAPWGRQRLGSAGSDWRGRGAGGALIPGARAPAEAAAALPTRLRSPQNQVGAGGLAGAELPGSDPQIRVCRPEPGLPRRGAESAHSGQTAGDTWVLSGW